MKNFESRIKKLEIFLNPHPNENKSQFDVTKLNSDDIIYLSDTLKTIRSESGKFDISKLTEHDLGKLNDTLNPLKAEDSIS